jgi:hypothetical protein
MRFCLSEPGEAAAGAELACDLWWYWLTHGHRTEGRRVLAALLDQLDQAAAVRLRVLWVAGYVAQYQGDIPGARAGWRPRCPPPARSAMSGRRRTHRVSLAGTYTSSAIPVRAMRWRRRALWLYQQSADQIGVVLALAGGRADRCGRCGALGCGSGRGDRRHGGSSLGRDGQTARAAEPPGPAPPACVPRGWQPVSPARWWASMVRPPWEVRCRRSLNAPAAPFLAHLTSVPSADCAHVQG